MADKTIQTRIAEETPEQWDSEVPGDKLKEEKEIEQDVQHSLLYTQEWNSISKKSKL